MKKNYVTLEEVCVKGSSNIAQKDLEKNEGKYPIYGASGFIKNVDFYAQDKPYIAVVKDGAGIGRTMMLPAHSSVIGTMQYLLPKDNIDISYLYYAVTAMNLAKYYTGATIPHIYFKDYRKEKLPVVDKIEQKKIVEVLSKIDALVIYHKRQLDDFEVLLKSRFIEMFGDINNEVLMSDICSIITDGTHQSPQFVDKGIPFLFVSNISNNEISYVSDKYISEETYKELYRRTPIEIGDIILSTVGSYGHPAIVKQDTKFLFQRHIAYLKLKKNLVNSTYIHSAILSNHVKIQIERKVKGIAQKTLNLSEIKNISIPLPPIDLQNQFADFVERTNKSKLEVQKSLEELETLKKSLMQQYFG